MYFSKRVQEIQFPLKSEKNNGYFKGRRICTFDHIALMTSWKEKFFKQKLYRKSKHVFIFNTLCPKIVPFMI